MPFKRLSKEEARHEMARLVEVYRKQAVDIAAPGSLYTELEARGQFIDPWLRALGWDVHNDAGLPQVAREVVLERKPEEAVSGRPDYRLKFSGRDRMPVEAKKPSVRLAGNADASRQARSYGWSLALPAAVLTNFAETVIFDTTVTPTSDDNSDVAVLPGGRFAYEEYLSRFDELWSRLSYESIGPPGLEAEYAYSEPPRGTAAFDRSFLAAFRRWRLRLVRAIHDGNPELGAAEIGRRTQRVLNALLFLRVCEDRNIGDYEDLLRSARATGLLEKFAESDRVFNAGLFSVLDDTQVDAQELTAVVTEMYWPRSPFAFGVMQPEILAEVYEQYLGERVVLRDGALVLEPKAELIHAGGIVPTPSFIVDALLDYALVDLSSNSDLAVLDPACGSGVFLVSALARAIEAHESVLGASSIVDRATLAKKLLWGIDVDGEAIEVTRLSILLAVLGEDLIDVGHERHVLPDLSENLQVGNSLVEEDFDAIFPLAARIPERRAAVAPRGISAAFPTVMRRGGFDSVVGNPPYVRIQVLTEFMPDQLAYFQDGRSGLRSAQSFNFDLYQLFIERCVAVLATAGRLAFIIPNRFMTAEAGAAVRGLLGPRLEKLVHFREEQVFPGRLTYTALIFVGPRTTEPLELELVDDLARWRSDRVASTNFVDRSELGPTPWTTASAEHGEVFARMTRHSVGAVGESVKIFVGVQTSADDVYFIKPSRVSDAIVEFTDTGGASVQIERAILRPAFRDRTLVPYGRNLNPDRSIIFPYEVTPPLAGRTRGRAIVYSPEVMTERFPLALRYFESHRARLAHRTVSPDPGEAFWAFGRSQSLTELEEDKLVVRVLSTSPQYVLDTNSLVAPGGGDGGPYYFLRPKSAFPYDIRLLQAIMSHPAVDAFVASRGHAFNGSYIVHRKRFLEVVPLPSIDGKGERQVCADLDEMDQLRLRNEAETDSVIRASNESRILALRNATNAVISAGYGLTAADSDLFN